jgi:nucleoside-diphosphate-sugar epimerase
LLISSPKNILLTGGTGFLGSHLAVRLLEEGHQLTLFARADANGSARARVDGVLNWHGVDAEARSRLRVVEGDLATASLGIGGAERTRLLAEVDEIVHCASETSFAERRRQLVEDVNIRGLERLLDWADECRRVETFHYLSTAYATGRNEGVCREDFIDQHAGFHNVYEETKCRGELMVKSRCSKAGRRAIVYRPSIVYGHSRTGRSLLFNAVYHPVRGVVFLRDAYLEDIRERGGSRAHEAGVSSAPDGTLHMPLSIAAGGLGINLVPVDFFTDAFAAIRASAPEDGGVFHIVAERPTPISDLVAFTSRLFGLSGIGTHDSAERSGREPTVLERAFERMIDVYRPYLSDRRTFAADRSSAIMARAGIVCPAFTYEVFERCMSHAVERAWKPGPS